MLHILTKDANPPYLSAGYESIPASTVECGAKVGERRSAITNQEMTRYFNAGTLTKRLCFACARKLGMKLPDRGGENGSN